MMTPKPEQGGAEHPDMLDRLHAQGKQRAARIPQFDVEQTLAHVLNDGGPDGPPQAGASRSLGISIGHRTLRLKLEIGRAKARAGQAAQSERAAFGWPEPGSSARCRAGRGEDAALAGRRGAASVSFWDALSPGERQAFRSRADERTFASGARLVREGETADHVIVILSGWTEIRVGACGAEQVIARRGPGQLVGERAALHVSVRSATVVAQEMVHALVVRTHDFAAFLSEHPAVLGIVEEQVYARLTEHSGPERQEQRPGRPPHWSRPHPSRCSR